MRLGAILGVLACAASQPAPIVPCEPTCRGDVIVACGRVVIDCAGHGARCSVEPDGLAVCVHDGGAR